MDAMLLRNSSEELEFAIDASLPGFYTTDFEKKVSYREGTEGKLRTPWSEARR